MPLIDVTHDGAVSEEALRRLGELLPDVVGEAVECPEEPSTGPVGPGDIEIRFRKKSPLDVGDLGVVIEVHTKPVKSAGIPPWPRGVASSEQQDSGQPACKVSPVSRKQAVRNQQYGAVHDR